MRFTHAAFLGIMATLFVCGAAAIELPTEGHVYFEKKNGDAATLVPGSGVLVLVSRINVCDKNPWLLREFSTTGIDAFVVRSDADGKFRVPSRAFKEVCSRVLMISQGFFPERFSLNGRVALNSPLHPNKELYVGISENDLILEAREPTTERVVELANSLYSPFTSYSVTSEMKEELYREVLPEIEKLSKHYPTEWSKMCSRIVGVAGSVIEKVNTEQGQAICESYIARNRTNASVPKKNPKIDLPEKF